jgi:acetyl esterase/lipase
MDISSQPVLTADHRIPYGPDASQFGDLWLPTQRGPLGAPVVVFFHGGWWKSEYDLGYAGQLCASVRQQGIACWSVEYRRRGSTGGGWPNTFLDAAAGFDFLAQLAKMYPLDLSRVMTMGHSAGGHLAFWIAGRHHVDPHSEIGKQSLQVPLRGTIALGGAVDLRLTIDLSGYLSFAHDKHEVFGLMGGRPADLPQRYQAGNPGDLLPFHIPQILIQGDEDDQIPPELPDRWVDLARHHGDVATAHLLPGADHFDVANAESRAWPVVLDAVRKLIGD